jgi:hypothetical protein
VTDSIQRPLFLLQASEGAYSVEHSDVDLLNAESEVD